MVGFWAKLICCSTVEQLQDGSLTDMWMAARAVGFPGSALMRRLPFSPGMRWGCSVSLITSRIRESPTSIDG